MKTTIEIRDDLLETARDIARQERRTLRSVFEEALHLVLDKRSQHSEWRLPDESFGGNGLCEGASTDTWGDRRTAIYGDRGG